MLTPTPSLKPHARLRRMCALAAWASAAVALTVAACADMDSAAQPDLDVERWPLRDILSASHEHHDALTSDDLDTLTDRSVEHALEDRALDRTRSDTGDAAAADHTAHALALLDELRAGDGLDSRLFGVYGHDADGLWSTPCAPHPDDLVDAQHHPARPHADANTPLPPRWTLGQHWTRQASPDAHARVRALAPQLARWAKRCAAQSRDDGLLTAPAPKLETVHHAPQAPALVAYWPEHGRLDVHPLLLALWTRDAKPNTAGSLTTRTARLTLDASNLDTCIDGLTEQCIACLSNADQCGAPLFDGGDPAAECGQLANREDRTRYCAFAVYQANASVIACVEADADFCRPTDYQPTTLADTLTAYAPFDTISCTEALDACTSGGGTTNPDPQPLPDLGGDDGGGGGGGSSCCDIDGPDINPCPDFSGCGGSGCSTSSCGSSSCQTVPHRHNAPPWIWAIAALALAQAIRRRNG